MYVKYIIIEIVLKVVYSNFLVYFFQCKIIILSNAIPTNRTTHNMVSLFEFLNMRTINWYLIPMRFCIQWKMLLISYDDC